MLRLPRTLIHCDWSIAAEKRWATTACIRVNGSYFIDAPKRTTPAELLTAASEPATLIGFDFPIGLPAAYATVAGISSFCTALSSFGTGAWSSFFTPATTRAEIAVGRPFYPHAPGGTKQIHIVEALGLSCVQDLYRACDRADGRRACPLFWTLGGNQVGKGALTGWAEFLQPAREKLAVDLWPFDGSLDTLLRRGGTVVLETYPGDVYRYVGATLPRIGKRQGKRQQGSRAASAEGMLRLAQSRGSELSANLVEQLRDGFGDSSHGEDMFDAVVGLLGMLAVLCGQQPPGAPGWPSAHTVEGWILGRRASAP